jgi:asparaginyl-tRNA synthetase
MKTKVVDFVANPRKRAMVKIESELIHGALKYLQENGFIHVVPPHLTRATGACENIDTMFQLDYFGKNVFLSQTGQLYLESFISTLGGVYCMGPSFRAEPKADDRHLTEFTLIELEFPTAKDESMDELIAHIEGVVMSMIKQVLRTCRQELAVVQANIGMLENMKLPFNRVTYTDAIGLLKKFGVNWGDDLKDKHEQFLSEHFNGPIFITHYPGEIKFFNMQPNSKDSRVVNSTDLVFPGAGESVGAACRIWNPKQLIERFKTSTMMEQLRKKGVSEDAFEWYTEVVEAHGMPHAGFGLGLGRLMKFVTGSTNIKESTAFPLNSEVVY